MMKWSQARSIAPETRSGDQDHTDTISFAAFRATCAIAAPKYDNKLSELTEKIDVHANQIATEDNVAGSRHLSLDT